MTIEELIKTMTQDYPEGNRTRMDMEVKVDGIDYKLMAYKIKLQDTIRIDIRKIRGQAETGDGDKRERNA